MLRQGFQKREFAGREVDFCAMSPYCVSGDVNFEIVRAVGRGGMGVVSEARRGSLNRRVALKVLGVGLGLSPRAVPRFLRGAEAAGKLHHTNIVPIYPT